MKYIICLIVVLSGQVVDANSSVGTTGSVGTVTINGEVYNQLSLRPEIPIGKLRLGLDLYLYFNDAGMYWESWDFTSGTATYRTIIDKIYYLRWGHPGDNLYFLAGALPSVTLGQGILVDHYSNIMEYPQVRQVGLNFQANISGAAIELIHSNFKSTAPGVLGLRFSRLMQPKLNLGFSLVTDMNQMAGLPDSDGDDYPDYYDFYPNDSEKFDDSLYWRNIYGEIAGDNYEETDFEIWYQNSDGYNDYDPASAKKDPISGIAIDITYVLSNKITLYSQFARLIGQTSTDDKYPDHHSLYGEVILADLGWGFVPIGSRAKFGPISLLAEYRISSRRFVFNYWDRAYDLNRVFVDGTGVVTRESQLYNYGKMNGLFVNAKMDIMNLFDIGMGYQNMQGEKWYAWNDAANDTGEGYYQTGESNQTLLTTMNINPTIIPKISKAEAFYQQSNVPHPFKFEPNSSTIWGYNVGIEISSGVMLLYQVRTTYIADLSNLGEFKPVKSIQIETQFIF